MNDWKGNKIKVGDTVFKIHVNGMFDGTMGACWYLDASSGESEKIADFEFPKQYLWNKLQTFNVVDGSALSYAISEEAGNVVIDESGLESVGIQAIELIQPQPYEILCIAGKSDNKDEYYLKQFEV